MGSSAAGLAGGGGGGGGGGGRGGGRRRGGLGGRGRRGRLGGVGRGGARAGATGSDPQREHAEPSGEHARESVWHGTLPGAAWGRVWAPVEQVAFAGSNPLPRIPCYVSSVPWRREILSSPFCTKMCFRSR